MTGCKGSSSEPLFAWLFGEHEKYSHPRKKKWKELMALGETGGWGLTRKDMREIWNDSNAGENLI